jgi:hypothetical protein
MDARAAAAALGSIETTERRTFQAVFYGKSAPILAVWGGVVIAGYTWTFAAPGSAVRAWSVLSFIGFAVTAWLIRRMRVTLTPPQRELGWRILAAQIALLAFGLIVVSLLGPLAPRQIGAFWPLLCSLGYVIAGLWIGRAPIVLGVTVIALTVAGFVWSGPWFPLWMAATFGGGLCLGALWLRWRGARL